MEFVLIPAGEFMMGTSEFPGCPYQLDEEKPMHRVRISKPFYLGKYPVTVQQWKTVMGEGYIHGVHHGDSYPNQPVEVFSRKLVQQFIWRLNVRENIDGRKPGIMQKLIQRLNTMVGKNYRLPTEAEWEYAARAGSETIWPWGDDQDRLGDYAWYSENSGCRPHPVGQKKANNWGLYDMLGNVYELCRDEWVPYFYAMSPTTDPKAGIGFGDFVSCVVRGGSCANQTLDCRPATRFHSWYGDSSFVDSLGSCVGGGYHDSRQRSDSHLALWLVSNRVVGFRLALSQL